MDELASHMYRQWLYYMYDLVSHMYEKTTICHTEELLTFPYDIISISSHKDELLRYPCEARMIGYSPSTCHRYQLNLQRVCYMDK